ncbi:hypothetical protein AB3662_25885 [Sorangium cellulosum]|uniref:hypothetical protein n=1 Tax=Sorangium cellulosum TaxID=56 RepID=UPI003D9A47D3
MFITSTVPGSTLRATPSGRSPRNESPPKDCEPATTPVISHAAVAPLLQSWTSAASTRTPSRVSAGISS